MLKNVLKTKFLTTCVIQNCNTTLSRCSPAIAKSASANFSFTNPRFKSSQAEMPKSNPFAGEQDATQRSSVEVKEEPMPAASLNALEISPEKRMKIYSLEMEVTRQEGRRAPDPASVKDEHWEHLLTLQSKSARSRYYGFLWQLEKKRESKETNRAERLMNVEKRKEEERLMNADNDHIIYGLLHTTMFLRIYDSAINFHNNCKLIRAMQFGQQLVFDCSYDDKLTKREAINTAKQLMLCFAENRAHDDPFDLHFCNADFKKTTMKTLERHIPTIHEPEFPLNVHEKCFTEIFPPEKLVYLTPHCRNEMKEFNHDDIYIIGGIVDRANNEPLSLAKAKRLGIRMAKLPLDKYLNWGSGSGKSLTLNQMVNILLDLKKTGNWTEALKHVPKRKLYENQIRQEENNVRKRAEQFDFVRKRPEQFEIEHKRPERAEFDVNAWATKKKNPFR